MAVLTPNYDRLPWRARCFIDALVNLDGATGRGGLNGAQAMRAIGFKGKRPDIAASKLLSRPEVRAARDERRAMVAEMAGLDAVQVLHGIQKVIDRCMQAYPVLDRQGNHVCVENTDGALVPAYTFDSRGALKGLELKGSYLKMFVQKLEHSGPNGGPIPLGRSADDMTDDELADLASRGRSALAESASGSS